MASTETTIVIRCGTCTYRLAYPAFFLESRKPAVQKIIKEMFKHSWQNDEAIKFLEREIPRLTSTVEAIWNDRIAKLDERLQSYIDVYERDFLDPNPDTFPAGMSKEQIRAEIQVRKAWNATRLKWVESAKSSRDNAKNTAKKDLVRAEQICALFLNEKRNY